MRIVFALTIVTLWHCDTRGYPDSFEEFGCHNTEFRLSCESLKGNIAILEAVFTQNYSSAAQQTCGNPKVPTNKTKIWEGFFFRRDTSDQILEISIRHAINRRCSGVSSCSFVLNEDFEAASGLGPGAVYLRYACINDLHIISGCNARIDASVEGFVRTPGYPEYYPGETSCLWALRAPPPQRVRVAFLDVSLRGIGPFEDGCLDWVVVSEDGLTLLSTCGDVVEDTSIISDGSALNVTFESSSKTLYPKRGILFHFKVVGCPSLQKPRDGYLVNRNETFVHFRCCVGFIFPDSLSRDKTLQCFNENTWDGVVLDCVNVTKVLNQTNNTDLAIGARTAMDKSDSLKDIVLPSIVMCILFIGNGIVLYLIYRQRRKLSLMENIKLKELPNTREA